MSCWFRHWFLLASPFINMQSLLTELSLSCCALNEGDQDGDGGRSLENLYVQLTIQPIPGVQPPTRVRTFPASEVQGFNHIWYMIYTYVYIYVRTNSVKSPEFSTSSKLDWEFGHLPMLHSDRKSTNSRTKSWGALRITNHQTKPAINNFHDSESE